MWKNYNRFYNEILYAEISLVTKISVVHQIGGLKKIVFSLNAKKSSGIKKAFLHLSCLHLVMDFKCKIVRLKSQNFNLQQKKDLTFGATFIIRKRYCFSFLFFSLFNLFGEPNPLNIIGFVKEESFFCLTLPSIRFLNRFAFNSIFFEEIANAQVLFLFNSCFKNTFFSLRFLKFPIKLL